MRRLYLLPLLALAACAAKPDWVNPSLSKERASADYAACRRYADSQIPPGDYMDPDDQRSSNPMRQIDRDDARKQFGVYVAMCMEDKGYHRVK